MKTNTTTTKKPNTLRKLVPALAMLTVSAITLSTASYAWFTMSRTVTAEGLNLTAIAPTNIFISSADPGVEGFDATNSWSSSATLTAITGAKLIPASSINGVKFIAAKDIAISVPDASTQLYDVSTKVKAYGNTNTYEPYVAKTGVDGYYADFPLWFKTSGEDAVDMTISLGLTSIDDTTKIGGAVRFAILNEKILDETDTANTGAEIITGTPSVIYGISKNVSTIDYLGGLTGPLNTVGVAGANYVGLAEKAPVYNADGTLNIAGDTGTTYYENLTTKIFTVPAQTEGTAGDEYVKIIVRVWVEGQDTQCVSTNASTAFNLTVGFSDVEYKEGITVTTTTTPTP